MLRLTLEGASALFDLLPRQKKIATLHPSYVAMDAVREDLTPTYLCYESGKEFWMHSLLQGHVPNSDFIDFQSPYGYGGPVASTDDAGFLQEARAAYEDFCYDARVLAEFVRLHPLIDQPFFGDKILNRETVYLPPGCAYPAKCRNMIRKAESDGLTAVTAPAVQIRLFKVSYREGMERLKADKFYFFNDAYFEALVDLPSSRLVIVEQDERWVAAGVFLEGAADMEYHLSVTNDIGRAAGATNMLIETVHSYASSIEKGLYLGGGKNNFSSDPLFKFKASFGGVRKPFYIGSKIHRPDSYYAMQEQYMEVGYVNPRTLFWR